MRPILTIAAAAVAVAMLGATAQDARALLP